MDNSFSDSLRSIARWRLEAKLDDIEKYFYTIDAVSDLTDGSKSFIVGRKGSGKTAIGEYILSISDLNVYSMRLSFQNVPFNDLYGYADQTYHSAAQFLSFWKYLIYGSVLTMLCSNPQIELKASDRLRKLTLLMDDSGSRSLVDRLRTLKVMWLGTGGEVSLAESRPTARPDLGNLVNEMEQFIFDEISDSTIYIVIDDLDEDYREFFVKLNRERYTKFIAGLYKAIVDIRHVSTKCNARLFPIACIRSDIVKYIDDPDKNKWRDLTVRLEWNPNLLKRMLTFRIDRALGFTGGTSTSERASRLLFEQGHITTGRKDLQIEGWMPGKAITILDYITFYSQWRPRDMINFLQQCAERQINLNPNSKICRQSIVSASKEFSEYLLDETLDEGHVLINGLRDILNGISHLGCIVVQARDLEEICESALTSEEQMFTSTNELIEALFDLCIIGLPSSDGTGFKYQGGKFRPNSQYVVHRGLVKALDLRPEKDRM